VLAGALLFVGGARLAAQVVPSDIVSTPIPVKPPTDTTGADTTLARADSIQPPVGRFADPILYEIGPQYAWNRRELFALGALTVVDLLERIPGLTTYRSGWIATPQTAAYNGDFQRVRIFYDGIEMDSLDPDNGGILDLSTVQLWTLEHLSVERSAGEARVFMRSWRVDNTTPYTRVDVATGNEETNLYRGFYGKRFSGGQLLQLAGQQYGVTSSRFAGSGDALSLLARVGMARNAWSVDAFVSRTHPTRGIQRPIAGTGRPEIPALDATHTTAYVRAAIGNQNGPWAQISAGSLRFKGDEVVTTVGDGGVSVTDTVSLAISEAQYNVSAGLTLGPARLEARDRLRAIGGNTYNSVSARLDVALPWTLVSGFAESDGFRRSTNADVGVRFQPLPFIAVSGSLAQTTARSGNGSFPSSRSARGEVGIKFFRPWVSFGAMTLDNALVRAPVVYDTAFQPIALGRSNGIVGSIRGPIAGGFGIDAYVTRWESQVPYRPQFQSRSEINFASTFPRRFPSGDFELRFAGIYEYRGGNLFPLRTTDLEVLAAKTVSALLEIRIMRAVISYQQRNILAYPHEIVPGFEMPRVLAIYGVRWEFWN
jgi:hypothetical protein